MGLLLLIGQGCGLAAVLGAEAAEVVVAAAGLTVALQGGGAGLVGGGCRRLGRRRIGPLLGHCRQFGGREQGPLAMQRLLVGVDLLAPALALFGGPQGHCQGGSIVKSSGQQVLGQALLGLLQAARQPTPGFSRFGQGFQGLLQGLPAGQHLAGGDDLLAQFGRQLGRQDLGPLALGGPGLGQQRAASGGLGKGGLVLADLLGLLRHGLLQLGPLGGLVPGVGEGLQGLQGRGPGGAGIGGGLAGLLRQGHVLGLEGDEGHGRLLQGRAGQLLARLGCLQVAGGQRIGGGTDGLGVMVRSAYGAGGSGRQGAGQAGGHAGELALAQLLQSRFGRRALAFGPLAGLQRGGFGSLPRR